MVTLLVATVGILSYTFLYAGSTKSEKAVDGKSKTECSYEAVSAEDCDWHARSAEVKASCDGKRAGGEKMWGSCKGEVKEDCKKKCDWESKHGTQTEESQPQIETK